MALKYKTDPMAKPKDTSELSLGVLLLCSGAVFLNHVIRIGITNERVMRALF